ncbi:hypothetical protein B0T26DRAFT_492365 [Lasiosphaeria miniovina]|uniref:Uncharacterized protein n=1 Tax=Lasiosphaeria miniovina TaxID=1954250 RepID=A0AA39ZTA7_9PEZI|nr:uncharacterized protein B0T26DRAFT_492365 [Lasiosphaeria miniovina]KAK0703213.1 hypothetical protein B0T26DRAFT_492365 [Lasiosphaeria miniovina]
MITPHRPLLRLTGAPLRSFTSSRPGSRQASPPSQCSNPNKQLPRRPEKRVELTATVVEDRPDSPCALFR